MTARPRQYQAEPREQQRMGPMPIQYVGGDVPSTVWPHAIAFLIFTFALLAAVLVFFGPLWMGGS